MKIRMRGTHSAKAKTWLIDQRYGRAYYKGYYEPALTKYIDQYLSTDSIFIDAGSHAGYFSLIAASKCKNGHVFSFEPESGNYGFIKKICSLNDFNNWTVENYALGEVDSFLNFQASPSSSMGMISEQGTAKVQAVSLDSYFSSITLAKIDLIKIDVEGYGGPVLKGARETIQRFKPHILFEVHLGSDEFDIAWQQLHDTYDFIDFTTDIQILAKPKKHMDFLLLKPKTGESKV
ncbi:MAG: FkbM family methyltransferase [Chitinophagaceae bacterium]